ncbi:MAG: hypothetical protein E6Q97_05565 [Desulfurellales bacterium]|nr:MAG: hypothetical protein E6Q97_05565 [Desulfurellales bacterium]
MRILALFFALLIACSPVDNVPSSLPQDLGVVDLVGSSPPDLTITVSGPTRIVQRTWTGSDGVVVKMTDLYDTVEKIPCALQRASDGVVRCLPQAGVIFFQDAACSVAVAHTVAGCAPDRYYRAYAVNQCGQVPSVGVYRTGGKINLTKLYLGSTCLDASPQIPAYDFYSLVAVPPSTFAAGTFNY